MIRKRHCTGRRKSFPDGSRRYYFHEPNEFHAIRSVGNSSPNLVVMSFITNSPAMNFFRKKNFTLNKSERTLVSCILNAAREALATPLHLPSIEQVKLKPNAPFGSQQMILLYLELFLITLEQNYLQLDAKPPEQNDIFHLPLQSNCLIQKRRESKKSFNICNFVSVNSSIRTRFASIFP